MTSYEEHTVNRTIKKTCALKAKRGHPLRPRRKGRTISAFVSEPVRGFVLAHSKRRKKCRATGREERRRQAVSSGKTERGA